ncbi:hypothetical protein ABH920_008376 [Catenulispora sp. EB89]|uniref:hypothetical protein n=1 Tax=Catenulispora sp. EB89 TaxID=3156257 RepID=UPI003512404A
MDHNRELSTAIEAALRGFATDIPRQEGRGSWRLDVRERAALPTAMTLSFFARRRGEMDEVLVVAFDCWRREDGGLQLSADLTNERGVILAEGPELGVDQPDSPGFAAFVEDFKKFLASIREQVVEELQR